MKRIGLLAISVTMSGIALSGCGGGVQETADAAAPAAAPIHLAGGATCSSAELATTVEAALEEGKEGGLRLKLKVCVRCGDQGVAGVTGITGQLAGPAKGIPPAFRKATNFDATNAKGCTAKAIKKAPGKLVGKTYKVTLVDGEGNVASEQEAAITKGP